MGALMNGEYMINGETRIPRPGLRRYWAITLGVLTLAALYLISLHSFLLFHCLVEIFSIVIAFGIFLVTWNSRQFMKTGYLLFVGIAYLFVAGLDLFHTLAYKGMGVFPGYDANLPTQLWIATRYLQSGSLLIAPIFFNRKVRLSLVLAIFSLISLSILASVFYWGGFPDCFVEGKGLTAFKKTSEYIISLILIGALGLLTRHRADLPRRVYVLIAWSIGTTIVSELAFTFYVSVYGLSNLVGHFFKVIATYLMYKAIVETGLREPYELLFRELVVERNSLGREVADRTKAEEALTKARDELEQRVDERTAELSALNKELAQDITERKLAEEALRASEEKYRTLFEESFDGIFITSAGGKILDMNKTGVAMFGYDTRDEILSLDLERDVYAHPPDRKRILAMVNAQGSAEYEAVVKKKSGEEMITHCALTAVKDERGVITSYRGIIRDITARRLAEEALRTKEVQLSNAVMIAQLGPWAYDVTKDLFTFNDHFYKLFRTTAEQVGGYTMSSSEYARRFVHPADMSVVGNEIRKSIEATDPDFSQQLEHRIVYADGEIGHISVRIFLVKDEFGRTVRTYGVNQDITERKRQEEALETVSGYNRSLIEASLDPLVTISAEGKVTDVNTATERVTGCSREELIGTDFADYFTDPQKAKGGYQRAFIEGEVKDYELQIRHRDGQLTPVMYNASVYLDNSGEIAGLFAAARDITEHKVKQELTQVRLNLLEFSATHSLDQLLQKTLDEIGTLTNSPIGFYHFISEDEKTIYLQMWSSRTMKEFCKAGGKGQHYPVDRGGVWVDAVRERCPVIHNDYATLPHRKGMPEGHAPLIRELVVPIMRAERIVAVLGIGNKPTDYSEKDIEIVSYLADVAWEISRRKRAEEDLKKRDVQYRTLFEDSIDGVYSVLRDGTMIDANQSFCELFGYTREEMIGKNIRDLYLDPADRPSFQREIEEKGFVKDYEIKFQKRDGTEVECLVTASVMFEQDGSFTGYRGIVRDLTARNELHRQLLQAQKMESVGTLAGGIAHDFNNILQVVLGYSELVLADEDLPDRLKNDLQKVFLSARNGADLVQRLLMFSRKTEIKPLDLDLNQRIRQTQKFLERTIPKMIDIELILPDDLDRIHADPTQMDQVLMNLAINARDAMPEGGRLVIETSNVFLDEDFSKALVGAKPGEYVILRVSDTGHGMDKETLDHVFEPFYTTKEAGKGTGLGLAMVHGIVHQHGAYITCNSEPGEGTTFKIYFPAVQMEMSPDIATTGMMPAFGTETILLVDDEEFVRDLGKRILERSGYTVLTAANGKEALELYDREREKISIVLLDLIMPTMGGKDCLRKILEIDPQAKVLIASGYAADTSTKECIELGAKEFVAKPFRIKNLLQQVRKTLDET
jgi:two-component system, cell cycle sensor histidine kinase and response regulator CckA